jgi:hypothetical protein
MAYRAIKGYEVDYSNSIGDLTTIIYELGDILKGPLKAKAEAKLKEADGVLSSMKDLRKSYNFELKLIKDHDERKKFQEAANDLDAQKEDLIKQLEPLKQAVALNKAGGDSDLTFLENGKINTDTAGRSNDQLLSGAATIQEMTKASVARSKALIDNSKEIGAETGTQLKEQRERLASIDQEAESINARLEKSRLLITQFGSRIAGDRLIQIFCAINIVILLAFIVYVVATGKPVGSLFVDTDAPTATPTVAPTP